MSRIYDAIKRLEAERLGAKPAAPNDKPAAGNGGNGHPTTDAKSSNGNGTHAAPKNGNGAHPAGNGNGHQAPPQAGNGNGHHAAPPAANGNGHQAAPPAANGNGHHAAPPAGNGNGHGHSNGHGSNGHGNGNGNGNGHGNGNGNGHRRNPLSWLFGNGKQANGHANGHSNGHSNGHGNGHANGGYRPLGFQLGPEVEEAYQRLGTNLLVAPGNEPSRMPRLLGVTASRHGEGTTTTAAVFASILARRRSGRVCVVEANLRAPNFETVFHIRRNGGFAELITGTQTLAEVAQVTEIPNLYAIGSGHTHMGPSALFDAPGVIDALEQLRQQFEYVIFDLPPVNVYSDTSILGPRLDAAIIVIEADRTRIPEVERTRRSLDRVGVHLVGTVLNRRRSHIPSFIEEML